MRGADWGRKHATVDYVFTHEPAFLVAYHWLVMEEMERRGYHPDALWHNYCYRGKKLPKDKGFVDFDKAIILYAFDECIYPEHNDAYLQECIDNLKQKGVEINVSNKTKER